MQAALPRFRREPWLDQLGQIDGVGGGPDPTPTPTPNPTSTQCVRHGRVRGGVGVEDSRLIVQL